MKRIGLVMCLAGLMSSLSAGRALAQGPGPQHPLEALKSQEYWTVFDVLRGTGKIDEDPYIPGVLLLEPPKERVLEWKPGDPVFREADVIVLRKGVTIEARVDIVGHKLHSWKERPDVQASEPESEYKALGEAIKKNPEVKEALRKRGITDLTTIRCGAAPYGYFAIPEMDGHRIMIGGCSDMHGVFLSYGRAIQGLHVQIDAANNKILKVIDEGVVPMPTGSTNFEETPENPRPGTTPIEVRQPAGPGFKVANGK